MMCFNMSFVDYALKKGCKAKGAGIHYHTSKAYVYFERDELFEKCLKEFKRN